MTNFDFEEDCDLIEMVENYAEDHESFDTEFIESLRDYYESKGYITDGQRDALLNIIKKYRIKKS